LEDTVNNQVENNTILIKERNIILTSDLWNIVVSVDCSAFEETLAKLQDGVYKFVKFKSRFTSAAELGHVKILVDFLESHIYLFTQMLHRIGRRRGLANVAGSVFRTLWCSNCYGFR